MYGKLLFHGSSSYVGRSMNYLLRKYDIGRDHLLENASDISQAILPDMHSSDVMKATASTIRELCDIRDKRLTSMLEPTEVETLLEAMCTG